MSLQVEKKEHNMALLTIEASAEEFEKAIEQAYRKQKGSISIPGFRKGKVPRQIIERMYGKGVFYDEAANNLIPDAYAKELDAAEDLEVVSQPKIEVTQAEAGKPFIFTAEVALKPEVTLGQYKGVEVPKAETEVTDEDVEGRLKAEQEKNGRNVDVTDRPVEDGDNIKLDFEGFIDGVAFEGGKGTDYPLSIGSGSFIPGFEEQLVGVEIGKETEVKVKFPEDYHAEELKGKDASFMCVVKSISKRELPELDDEFASEVSEFDTLEAFKDDLRKKIADEKASDAKRERENNAVDKVIENAQMDIPDPMVDTQVRQMMDEFAQRLSSQGLSMDQYMQFTGATQETLAAQTRPDALKRIQSRLVLEAVADAENIEISDERVNEEIAKMAESYNMEADKLKELIGDSEKNSMKKDIAVQDALTLISDAAVEA